MSKHETQKRAKAYATDQMRRIFQSGGGDDSTTNIFAGALVAFSEKEIELLILAHCPEFAGEAETVEVIIESRVSKRVGKLFDEAMIEAREQVLIDMKDAYISVNKKSLSNAAIDAVLVGDFETFFAELK